MSERRAVDTDEATEAERPPAPPAPRSTTTASGRGRTSDGRRYVLVFETTALLR